MEKHLWVLRHATAEAGAYGLSDFERNLTPQGQGEALKVGVWLDRHIGSVDMMIASPSVRTRQTTHALCESSGYSMDDVNWEKQIYEASIDTLMKVVISLSEELNSVILVGHNPGLEMLVSNSVSEPAAQGIYLQPASLAHIIFPMSWGEALGGLGKLDSILHVADY